MKEHEIEYHFSTRVGPYLWDIDVESMGLEELEALSTLISDMKVKREKEQRLLENFKRILKKAEEEGYHFVFEDEHNYVDITGSNRLNYIKLNEM